MYSYDCREQHESLGRNTNYPTLRYIRPTDEAGSITAYRGADDNKRKKEVAASPDNISMKLGPQNPQDSKCVRVATPSHERQQLLVFEWQSTWRCSLLRYHTKR